MARSCARQARVPVRAVANQSVERYALITPTPTCWVNLEVHATTATNNATHRRIRRESVLRKLSATATAAVVTSLYNPLVAEASITPSLKNTLLSVVAGGVVLAAIAVAVIGVSSFDKVSRK